VWRPRKIRIKYPAVNDYPAEHAWPAGGIECAIRRHVIHRSRMGRGRKCEDEDLKSPEDDREARTGARCLACRGIGRRGSTRGKPVAAQVWHGSIFNSIESFLIRFIPPDAGEKGGMPE